MRKRIAYVGMVIGAVLFAAADIFAKTQEKNDQRVTTSSWIRYAVRKSKGTVGVLGVSWVIWHFVVQAWFPELPL